MKRLESTIEINASPAKVWDAITNVRLEEFSDPWYFRMLGIPKPMRAEVISTGVGGKRIAYFENGKRFVQEILVWDPFSRYDFTFQPDPGFRVAYLFDLASGVFRLREGSYRLLLEGDKVLLSLATRYTLEQRGSILAIPIAIVLKIFQKYLLVSIKQNSERGASDEVK